MAVLLLFCPNFINLLGCVLIGRREAATIHLAICFTQLGCRANKLLTQ